MLDVACGPGALSNLFAEQSYTGVDLNPIYIDYAKKHYRGEFFVHDARTLPFPESHFDEALVYGLLHHLNDDDLTADASGIRLVVRPGGIVLVIVMALLTVFVFSTQALNRVVEYSDTSPPIPKATAPMSLASAASFATSIAAAGPNWRVAS